jgi:hypothetical protein
MWLKYLKGVIRGFNTLYMLTHTIASDAYGLGKISISVISACVSRK